MGKEAAVHVVLLVGDRMRSLRHNEAYVESEKVDVEEYEKNFSATDILHINQLLDGL